MNNKLIQVKKELSRLTRSDKLKPHRIWIILTTHNGQKKLWQYCIKSFRFLLSLKSQQTRDYQHWIEKNYPTNFLLKNHQKELAQLTFQPKISVLLPVYNAPLPFLKEAIYSVQKQVYENWELCIADDHSDNNEIRDLIKEFASKDERINYTFRSKNGHISKNSNTALELATGQYVALLDHDDKLSPDALFQNVKLLNKDYSIDLIYSDEDKIDAKNNHLNPAFKPDWCPDSFLSRNYLCHLIVVKKELIDKVGGFRVGFEGSQDYDLLLRITELPINIQHIPKILYHWRVHPDSTSFNPTSKVYAFDAGTKALNEALVRRKIKGKASLIPNTPGSYHIKYEVEKKEMVSMIIPTKDQIELCEALFQSIFNITAYNNFEILLISNNSSDPLFSEMVEKWSNKHPSKFKCITENSPFNFSKLMNIGAKQATGKYLLLLNNDTEVIHPDWLEAMVAQAQFNNTGAVGARLLYANNTIQHAGVIVGLGGCAGHHHISYDENAYGYGSYLKTVNNFSALTGACLMVRKATYTEVGGFDEQLAVEFNDIDFCLKLKEKGYHNVYLPHVRLYHFESISRGHPHKTKSSYQQHINDVTRFKEKWKKYIEYDPCYNPNLSLKFDDFRLR